MLSIRLEGHNYKNELFDVVRLFYHDEEIIFFDEPRGDFRGFFMLSRLTAEQEKCSIYTEINSGNERLFDQKELVLGKGNIDDTANKKLVKREIKRQAYILLAKLLKKAMPWGMLTGIRPAKIVNELLDKGMNREDILGRLQKYYMVSEEKSDLAYNVAKVEKTFLDKTSPDMIGLYIGIPFCPTRCLYCSFTSNPIKKYEKFVQDYLSALFEEINQVGKIIIEKGLTVQSIYIGGGTPTAISAVDLKSLLDHMEQRIDLSHLEEYTLEAGRPDSINAEKLLAIKSSKVDRISINPQSMNDGTLKLIGRNHTSEDIRDCFKLARELGFDNINMDIIAGLPGENSEMFENTLKEIKKLSPDSLTVHTMSIKRASRLKEEKDKFILKDTEEIERMIELAQIYAYDSGMHPYYLYRQKNILGNLENVGYCKPGRESVYNIQIMEERQTIIALGAGAITKVVYPEENRIERAFNVKGVEEYVSRLNEMVERKKVLLYDLKS